MTPDLAAQIGLAASQQGALVIDVTPIGPAAKAGLIGSTQQQGPNGQMVVSGGDVIIRLNGQMVTLMILRQGKQQTVDLTLRAASQGN